MSNLNEKKLFKAVIKELNKIKIHATQFEIEKLNGITMDGGCDNCFYGQLTGDSFSSRAYDLIALCAKPFSNNLDEYTTPTEKVYSKAYPPEPTYGRSTRLFYHPDFTAIEYFVVQEEYQKYYVPMVDYVKGNPETKLKEIFKLN